MSFLLREIAESWGWKKRHWGQRYSTKHNLFLCFIFAVSIISFSLSWSSMVEIILFTCCVGDQVGFVVQFILSAHSTLSEFVLNDARVELSQEAVGGSRNLLTLHKDFQESPKSIPAPRILHRCCATRSCFVLSHGRAWGGVCCAASMLPSHKAGLDQENGIFFSLSLGHGIPDNWHFVPGRAIHPSPSPDSNQAKQRRSSLWRPFCWKGLRVAFGFNYPVSFSACLSFDCTGWAGCVFPWNKVLHPSWESAGRPQEQ